MVRPLNPYEVFVESRGQARTGRRLYDGDRFPVSFNKRVQRRIDKLARVWGVPRAEMVRYLVMSSLDAVEQMPVPLPKEDQPTRKEGTK